MIYSKPINYESAFVAKLLILKWALELAKLHDWNNIWFSDASNMVKEILFETDP